MPVKKNLMVRFFAIIECHIYISFFDDLKKNGVYKKSLNATIRISMTYFRVC